MKVDPVASMRCWALTLELGGREFEIPALPAVDWWPVLVSGDLVSILDFVVSSSDDLDAMLLDGRVEATELSQALTDAVEEATGRAVPVAVLLAMAAESSWPVIGGQLAQSGFRWDRQPIGAALDAVYSVIVNALEKEPREKFLGLITKAENRGAPIDREQAMSDFEAMAGPRPAPRPRPERASAGPSDGAPPRTPR